MLYLQFSPSHLWQVNFLQCLKPNILESLSISLLHTQFATIYKSYTGIFIIEPESGPFHFPLCPYTHTHTHHNQLEYCQRIMYKRSPCCHSWSPTVYPQHIPQSDLLTNKSRHITPQFKALHAYVCAQSCPILCHPMNCSLTGSSVHGVFQARIMQWVAIFFSRRSSQSRDQTHVSCVSCIGRQFIYQLSHQGPSLPN